MVNQSSSSGQKDVATRFIWLLFTLLAKNEGSRPLVGLMENNKTSCAPPGMGSVDFPHIPWGKQLVTHEMTFHPNFLLCLNSTCDFYAAIPYACVKTLIGCHILR